MGKIEDFDFKHVPFQLIQFKDSIRDLVNYGKFQFPVVTAVPTWLANEGEVAFYNVLSPATDRRIYVRLTTGWYAFSQILGIESSPTSTSRIILTSTGLGVSSNNTADTTLIRGVVGTTNMAALTLSEGRTIRLQAWGYYNTPIVPDNLTMRVKIGGTTVLSTGAQTPAGTVSTGGWALNANIICLTTGGAGTVMAQGDFPHFTAAATYVNWQMVTSSTTVINTTAANTIEVTAQWGGASAASQLFMTNCHAELLN